MKQPKTVGRTTIYGRNWVELDKIVHGIKSMGMEPTVPGFDYDVEVLQFTEARFARVKDAALIQVGFCTPPELVLSGQFEDYYLDGSGDFVCVRPSGELEVTPFNPRLRKKSYRATYGPGCYFFWRAGEGGLRLIEVCTPPFSPSSIAVLNMDGTDPYPIPEAFMSRYHYLTKLQSFHREP